ncbi:sugar phosphate isomerase/epimerase [Halorussus gelatinilyticus]|uniref:Sugar phosphate isomerase/epimerase n=1 Tax=Halorussus gelatinilyticus TaxID=2937524 RepID=A0A8U0IGG1_9EURY|nr:sugar phosphate isomerase/epimerase family protein [Halorussus gelatinilyticus]UPV99765.1 sugar phosphate isomerase/epimerase [Halorussus gelatinilyticus]
MNASTGFVTQVGMDYETAFDAAAELDFDFVELLMDGDHERRRLDPAAVREAAGDRDLDLLVHLPFALDVGSAYEHVREGAIRELVAASETAAEMGAEKGVAHATSKAWSPAWDDADVRETVLESVRELDAGTPDDFEVCFENVPNGALSTGNFPDLFADTEAAMTLDTGHARVDGLDSTELAEFAARYADRISHVHLNDTRNAQDEHLPFGAGTIDFEAVLGALPDDWSGTLSLEVFTLEYGYIGVSKEYLDDVLGRVEG